MRDITFYREKTQKGTWIVKSLGKDAYLFFDDIDLKQSSDSITKIYDVTLPIET